MISFKDAFRKNGEKLWGRSIVFKLGDKVSFYWDRFTPKKIYTLPPYLVSLGRRSFEIQGGGKSTVLTGNFTMDGRTFFMKGVVEGSFRGGTPFKGNFLLKGEVEKNDNGFKLSYTGYINLNMGIECFPKKVSISYKKVEGWVRW